MTEARELPVSPPGRMLADQDRCGVPEAGALRPLASALIELALEIMQEQKDEEQEAKIA